MEQLTYGAEVLYGLLCWPMVHTVTLRQQHELVELTEDGVTRLMDGEHNGTAVTGQSAEKIEWLIHWVEISQTTKAIYDKTQAILLLLLVLKWKYTLIIRSISWLPLPLFIALPYHLQPWCNYVGSRAPCLPLGRILTTCSITLLRIDRKCTCVSMFPEMNSTWVITWSPRQNGCHFTENIFKYIFLNAV